MTRPSIVGRHVFIVIETHPSGYAIVKATFDTYSKALGLYETCMANNPQGIRYDIVAQTIE